MRKFIAPLLVMSFLAAGASVQAREENPFITSKEIDLIKLLPPPPANDSLQTKAELSEVLALQAARTPEMTARSQADATEEIWHFADVMGVKFKREQLPVFAKFFQRVVDSEGAVVDTYKDVWKRPRPFMVSDAVKPVVKLSRSGAYPSGHATAGTLMGIVLANMVPEKRAEIMARAAEYANNRIIGGVHYRSDIDSGRITGTVIAARLQTRDDFNTGFIAARDELRGVLQLGAQPAEAK
ncbi:phosphatase PAP2 family protein [Collimonas pratensis]|uniref:acid phosphatase n=1 Tax=Collimonas pratensis TaxID=279113 RepID=UPI00143D68EF|nr:phosphatase PAP2 family protein [Collimonas pratensis]NKI69729.1 phosphatase PAP2 family protein [Collimonas pratensis]